MANLPVVLLVGVTGMLGYEIALAILDKGTMELRALVRADGTNDENKKKKLDVLKAKGATFVEGDIMNPESLPGAVAGVEAVISAIGNEPDSYIAGQTNLLEAAERAGVKRFVPSDFTGDYHKLDYGDNFNTDMRKRFFEVLRQSSVPYMSINNGAFMEVMLTPFIGTFNLETGTFNYWGEGDELCDFTSYPDVAKYTAEAVGDESLANVTLEFAGEVTTLKQMLAAYEEVTGRKLTQQRLGSLADLKASIENAKASAKSPVEYLGRQYLWIMQSGKAKLEQIANERYPHIKPVSFRQFFSRQSNAQAS
ncbi:aromatic alcohol reductase [Iningainema tapete]|uniref:NmrA family NAD(P)-binding protein n=1 Tax=Iningainema tapete BLCC-T55 TaxID=2748662 RepID=A0A8J7BZM6_9CYAN|nr:aromatic alcohol reductase [Iningainema tapete]MBD2776223.1 NmrA family NAD(P)-binding protein [Iningainema tapete BLCC-T55]